jgi:hypothetical protein
MSKPFRFRGLYRIIRDREEGIHLTERGLERHREREHAQLVREQRDELAWKRGDRAGRGL